MFWNADPRRRVWSFVCMFFLFFFWTGDRAEGGSFLFTDGVFALLHILVSPRVWACWFAASLFRGTIGFAIAGLVGNMGPTPTKLHTWYARKLDTPGVTEVYRSRDLYTSGKWTACDLYTHSVFPLNLARKYTSRDKPIPYRAFDALYDFKGKSRFQYVSF